MARITFRWASFCRMNASSRSTKWSRFAIFFCESTHPFKVSFDAAPLLSSGDIMTGKNIPIAVVAAQVTPRTNSNYPEPFASRMEGREKRPLGDLFGLANFGVNLTHLFPGASSALRHAHAKQDEFIYILQGQPVLITDAGETPLSPGMCAGFKAGTGNAHQLVNTTAEVVSYLEIGDRSAGDSVVYPDDDIQALLVEGSWKFSHKDGSPY
jgi:uncharacterized cupin superfamily protein